ncbi:hypothetical protein DAEQUDRAFT_152383 [Daedalea quercina L-15889]|uniref:DUF7605 domain-containing protein n=1 Tax=Daedalea quercina L-15889 TaxID=1314783 RepID=A0A165RLP9_9APHY|nr:hypothetical protein DAEQUDRAFT_152383 [Daedalea quercina L-15889]
MHWSTYRGTLRRYGSWRRDLNVELTVPFTRDIAARWSSTFTNVSVDFKSLSISFKDEVSLMMNKYLAEVEKSATPLLKDLAKKQTKHCRTTVRRALPLIVSRIRSVIDKEQKEASRCLAPRITETLKPGYEVAAPQSGPGSSNRRKSLFHDYLARHKDLAFADAAGALLVRLDAVSDAMRAALEEELNKLSDTMEVNMSILWDRPSGDNPLELKACARVTATMVEIREQIRLWRLAGLFAQ